MIDWLVIGKIAFVYFVILMFGDFVRWICED